MSYRVQKTVFLLDCEVIEFVLVVAQQQKRHHRDANHVQYDHGNLELELQMNSQSF